MVKCLTSQQQQQQKSSETVSSKLSYDFLQTVSLMKLLPTFPEKRIKITKQKYMSLFTTPNFIEDWENEA